MISGIDRQSDISIFFEDNEFENISKGEEIAGILIRTNRPESQGCLKVKIDDDRKNLNGFGIGIDDKKYWGIENGFEIEVFIGDYYLEEIKKRGVVGVRQQMLNGSKITVYRDINSFEARTAISDLKFYYENREKYKRLNKE